MIIHVENGFSVEYTDPFEFPFWDESFEEIVMSYPEEERPEVRRDLLNARNLDKYGIEHRTLPGTLYDSFSHLMRS